MALTGLQIQKLLPKTNCKECGASTCMAFAMKLAGKKAELSECPYASEEAKSILGAAAEPPIKTVKFNKQNLSIGGETVFYRHEKTFVNKPIIAINIYDDCEDINLILNNIMNYKLERTGEFYKIDAICISQKSLNANDFSEFVGKIINVLEQNNNDFPVILRANLQAYELAAEKIKDYLKENSGILCGNDLNSLEDYNRLIEICEKFNLILSVSGENLDEIRQTVNNIKNNKNGFNNLLLEYKNYSLSENFMTNSIARRAALKHGEKLLGYASLKFIKAENHKKNLIIAVNEITKFGGVLILPEFDAAQLAVLITLRQNIYTDPQKPIQVEPKLYAIGEPDRNSPIFVTTNFSLTYFLVTGEIENSGISAWLLVPECEGMSVLTAWAAGKFSGAKIAAFAKEIGLESLVDSREIIIPGYVAQISGELEEELPGYKIIVGPQESADIESFVKTRLIK